MSRIDKLSVQGIRSFGPDEPKKIEFYTPLTLILGQNGCGKTTIIEALKYATTGEVPPGCGRGAYFVHDPKVANESTVRGQIKLLFHCKRGNKDERIVATRSLEVTQKAKKLECKTVDATITRTLPDGKKQSISHKCADIQAEMTSMMGVSKPILENVIFCHQEDSNWPLDEGKKVKDKFDAIFNATKYIKCLDTIKKLRVDERKRMANMKETIDALKSSKEHAVRLRKEFDDLEKDEGDINTQIETNNERLTVIRVRLNEIMKVESSYNTLEAKLERRRMELDSNKKMQESLRKSQTESFSISDNELHQMILDFERHDSEKQVHLQQVEMEIEGVERTLKSTKNRHSFELQKLGRLEAAHSAHLEDAKFLNKRVLDLIQTYNISGFSGETFEYHEAQDVISKVMDNIEKENDKITARRIYYKDKEDDIQEEIDSCRKEESSLENEIRNFSSKLAELSTKSHSSRLSLQRLEDELSFINIQELQASIASTVREIEKEEKLVDVTKLQEDIEDKKRQMYLIEQQIGDVKQKISKMTQQGKARAQHDIFVKKKQDLENGIKFLQRKNCQDLEYVFGKTLGENLRNELDYYNKRIQSKKESVESKISGLEVEKAQIKFKIENDKSSITKKEKEISDFEDKLQDLCGSHTLDTSLNRTNEQLDKLMRAEADKTSSTTVMSSYIAKLREDKACPLCFRDFQSREEVGRLIESLEMKMEQLPDHLRQVKANLKANKEKQVTLLQLKPRQEQAMASKMEIEKLKEGVTKYQEKFKKLEDDLEEANLSLDSALSDESISKRITSDVIEIDKSYKEINNIKTKLDELSLDLNQSDCDLTMEELMKLQTQHENKIKVARDEIDGLQKKIMEHKDRLQKLNNKKLTLSTKELEVQNKSKEVEKLKEEISQCERDKITFEAKQEEYKERVAPLKFLIKDKLESKNRIAKECQAWVDEANQHLENMKEKHRRASDRCKCVKNYIMGEGKEKLSQSKNQVSNLDHEMKSLETRKRTLFSDVADIKDEIARKQDKKRNLDDELTIRKKEKERQLLEKDILDLKSKIKDFDYGNLRKEREGLICDDDKLTMKNANSKGRLDILDKRKQELIKILNKPDIKNAERNYKDKFVEMKCIELATEDLNKYYKALYTAIMRFHSEKMATINRIIRELWRTTYKGNDIDFIDIKTDESEIKGADKRQTYNYRVVMVKNDVEMDMRGRCSAGQKVLASLIIRMALAETFNANCGILALDEPTTNLDKKNIEALALALLNIVNRRSHQRNFQLIVITHDEEFLNKLTKADFIEYYLHVSRDHRGLSDIKKKPASKY